MSEYPVKLSNTLNAFQKNGSIVKLFCKLSGTAMILILDGYGSQYIFYPFEKKHAFLFCFLDFKIFCSRFNLRVNFFLQYINLYADNMHEYIIEKYKIFTDFRQKCTKGGKQKKNAPPSCPTFL